MASPWELYSTIILVGFSGAKNWNGRKQKRVWWERNNRTVMHPISEKIDGFTHKACPAMGESELLSSNRLPFSGCSWGTPKSPIPLCTASHPLWSPGRVILDRNKNPPTAHMSCTHQVIKCRYICSAMLYTTKNEVKLILRRFWNSFLYNQLLWNLAKSINDYLSQKDRQ